MAQTTFKDVIEGIGGAILIGTNLGLWPFLHSWRVKWGATDEELKQTLNVGILSHLA